MFIGFFASPSIPYLVKVSTKEREWEGGGRNAQNSVHMVYGWSLCGEVGVVAEVVDVTEFLDEIFGCGL